jgi:DNA-binding HxlR family transcriptional regulator
MLNFYPCSFIFVLRTILESIFGYVKYALLCRILTRKILLDGGGLGMRNIEAFNCEKELTLSIIGGKWKMIILWHIGLNSPQRFSELRRLLPNITQKMLTSQLRELESDGIIERKVYPQVPPKVEYTLTEDGLKLIPILELMYEWGKNYISKMDDKQSANSTENILTRWDSARR